MKKLLFLMMLAAMCVSCSSDESELDDTQFDLLELNATYEVDGCTITTFDFATLGFLEVKNDPDFLYITVYANPNNTISSTSLHVGGSFQNFPTVGKGNLQPQRMAYQQNFGYGVMQYTFQIPVIELGNSMVIASYTTFNGNVSHWAGDIPVKQGNWAYFEYQQKAHPFNAGPDGSRTITLSEARKLPSWDEVRKIYAGMLAPGVDRKSGIYNPTIWDLIHDFNDPARESQLGEYKTTYTLGTGECTDSVELTMIVIPD